MHIETEDVSELFKAAAALTSTVAAIVGVFTHSPTLLVGAIVIGGLGLYGMIISKPHGRDESPPGAS